ncbi:MAG: hypothetical protein LH481_08055 [Burkholderiales bacterium]|nr:hypothetical protein [Burkholderiales bacterium]
MSPKQIQLLLRLLTAMLVFALGWQFAWWTWHLITPSLKTAAFAPSNAIATDMALGRQLFGDAVPVTDAVGAAPQTAIRLKGVFAVDGKTLSAAVLNIGGRDQAVKIGQELATGVTLAEVHANFVVLSRAGIRERIELDRFENRNAKTAAAAGAAPAAQFRLNVASSGANAYSLSRQELNSVLQDPRQQVFFNGRFGTATGGGVRVEDAPGGSLLEKLGIKTGDIITGVNGQPVNSQGDLVRLYQQFGTLSSIRAEVRRGGAPVMLSYTIQQ